MTNQAPLIVQFMSTRNAHKTLTLWERFVWKGEILLECMGDFRVSYVEEQAIHNLIEKLTANKNRLMKEFVLLDPQNIGMASMRFFIIFCWFSRI